MIIWTQQKLAFWEDLEHNNEAYCNEESWLYKEYGFAYDWMVNQMAVRLTPSPKPEIKLPLWGWVQYNNYKSRKPKFTPNKSESGYYPEVFIEADIPDELLLQSNFSLWAWCCMNGWEIGDALEREIDRFNALNNMAGYNFLAYPDDLKQRIMKSWECIFDLDYRNRRFCNQPRRNKSIQATFWLLRKEWVRDVRFFIPK